MYPIILTLTDRRAVVVGGGVVAERKVRGLRDAGAHVTVISPGISPELARLADAGEIVWEPRLFSFGDCKDAALAFAATDDAGVNAAVVVDARKHGVPANDASDAARGDFVTPAVHRSGPLTVTIDSGGLSPTFTARIRDELALQFDARYARAAATLGALRARVLAVVPIERRAAVMAHFSGRDIDDLAAMPHGAVEHEVERAVDTLGGVLPGLPPTLICASRASALAMWQTRTIMALLARSGIASTVLNITTKGDAVQDRSLAAIGTDSLFVKELENALRDGRADYAVHSCKDLPSTLPDDMTLAAVTVREDPRDAYCSERYPTFDSLPPNARVGTSSPRRRAQLSALRADLRFDDIRGNVDTRLRKLRDGDYDAIILASAGMKRLELRASYTVPFPVDVLVPAVAQGALGIEMRDGDPNAGRIGAILNDPRTDLAVRAERAFLRTLRGGCQAPVGAHATYDGSMLRMQAAIAAPDGSAVIRDAFAEPIDRIDDAETAAVDLAHAMLTAGGSALLAAVFSPSLEAAAPGALAGLVFVVGRTGDSPSKIAIALREEGAEVVEAHDGAAASAALGARAPNAVLVPSSGSVRAITEYLATLGDNGSRPLVVAMGPSSAATAAQCGWPPDAVAPDADIASFVQTVTRTLLENAP